MIHSLEGPTEQFKIINFLLLLKASNLFHKCSEYSCSTVSTPGKIEEVIILPTIMYIILKPSSRILIRLTK